MLIAILCDTPANVGLWILSTCEYINKIFVYVNLYNNKKKNVMESSKSFAIVFKVSGFGLIAGV